MSRIIQFLHPGKEHNNITGTVWNCGNHKRKFLRKKGSYLKDLTTKPIDDIVYFWGEWEAPSKVTPTKQNNSNFSKNIFEPYCTSSLPKNSVNTDPFVFGNQFYYCTCKQGHYPSLRDLEKGDILLFGSKKDNYFILDTLFVVKDWKEYKKIDIKDLKSKYNNVFYDVSLKPMVQTPELSCKEITEDKEKTGICKSKCGDDKTDYIHAKDTKVYRIYNALMYEDNKGDGIFSYSPCLPDPSGKNGFERPAMNFPYISQTLKQGIKIIRGEDIDKAWHQITQEILNKGLKLMIKTDLPHYKLPL